jgi:hypothetical protein
MRAPSPGVGLVLPRPRLRQRRMGNERVSRAARRSRRKRARRGRGRGRGDRPRGRRARSVSCGADRRLDAALPPPADRHERHGRLAPGLGRGALCRLPGRRGGDRRRDDDGPRRWNRPRRRRSRPQRARQARRARRDARRGDADPRRARRERPRRRAVRAARHAFEMGAGRSGPHHRLRHLHDRRSLRYAEGPQSARPADGAAGDALGIALTPAPENCATLGQIALLAQIGEL